MAAGAAMPVAAILSLSYSKQPARAIAGLFVAVHAAAVIANASVRQIVQIRSLEVWAKLDKLPIRGDWDSFLLFVVVLLIVLVGLGWLARIALRAGRLKIEHKSTER